MITFWVNSSGRFGIDEYRAQRGKEIAERFAVRQFEGITPLTRVTAGAQIFAGLDQLPPAQLALVAGLQAQLRVADPGIHLLNDAGRTLRRFPLLTLLADIGLNQFRAYRVDGPWPQARFPVFVREAIEHSGSLSGLLHSEAEVRRVLRALKVRGFGADALLVVEFCDSARHDGMYRKYAAFRVGQAIVPTHLLASKQWMVKAESNQPDVALAEEELRFVEENPHADWLRRVSDLAGVSYGRIDYGVAGGEPQLWEINLNPTLGRRLGRPARATPEAVQEIRERARALAHQRLREAFAALDTPIPGRTIELTLSPSLVRQAARESRRNARRNRRLEFLRRVHGSSLIGGVMRRVLNRLFPHP